MTQVDTDATRSAQLRAVPSDALAVPGPGWLPSSIVDPKGGADCGPGTGAPSGRNVLVVSTVDDGGASIRPHLGADDRIKVVVPVVRQGFLDWLANDESAFAQAQDVAERTAELLPGDAVDARAGEADLELAIRDALATFPAEEIVVAVRNRHDEGLVEGLATKNMPTRSVAGIPIRCVVVGA